MRKIKQLKLTVDNHLDEYGTPTRPQTRTLHIEYEDGQVLTQEQ